ncbi:MAG: chromosome partitioning protein [Candidatus Krumholzibacteriia bacterium]|jgi:chromosome partitioning protein
MNNEPDFPPAPRSCTQWNTVGGRVISMISRKGGVGKTTSAVNLGAAFALSGHSVLIIGTDPQCGVCRTLGTKPVDLPSNLVDLFDGQHLTDLALAAPLENLFYVSPRIITLADEEEYMACLSTQSEIFVAEIERARNLYDTILIDCPPNLGPATRAALLASDSYLVPVQAEELCAESVSSLLSFVDTFKSRTYPDLDQEFDNDELAAMSLPAPLTLEGLFLTMASAHTRMGKHVAARVSDEFGDLLFSSGIPRNTRLSEMALRGKPAVIFDRRSAGSRAYFDLADELIDRYSSGVSDNNSLIDAMIASMSLSLADSGQELKADKMPNLLRDLTEQFEEPISPLPREIPAQVETEDHAVAAPFEEPEMVSLEDLLAEEENNGGSQDDDWDDNRWSSDYEGRGRVN